MRVALLSASAPSGDAIGNQLAEKAAFFADRGADLRVFLEADHNLHPGVRPYYQPLEPRCPLSAAWRFLASADLAIFDYSQHYGLLDLLPLLVGGKLRIIFDYHGVTPPHFWGSQNREPLEKGIEQRGLVWCSDAAIVHSRFAAAELCAPTRFRGERLRRLGYVVDTDWFRAGGPLTLASPPGGEESRRADCQDRLGRSPVLPEEAGLLLFVGRLAPNKRVPILIEALAHLRDRSPPVHAVVIGNTNDVYRLEANRCRQLAKELGVADRFHMLGPVDGGQLREAYRSADVLVIPSRHESFCLPVLEAMACGLPVVAARAGALPETVGSAGLTFTPDDPQDLARQLLRVLDREERTEDRGWRIEVGGWRMENRGWRMEDGGSRMGETPAHPQSSILHSPSSILPPWRVAIVACRYGSEFVGGVERSLQTIAEALHQTGHHVEVYTTCIQNENDGSDRHAPGSRLVNGVPVHRFPIDPRDPIRYTDALRQLAGPSYNSQIEQEVSANAIRSGPLLEALGSRNSWDAIIVGPYLAGLTLDVARAFADRTILLPCFHDEPAARLATFLETYRAVGGVLYHSPEEQRLAEVELGLNHPRSACLGTLLEEAPHPAPPRRGGRGITGEPEHGRQLVGSGRRYLLFAGRYTPGKNFSLLLKYARRYAWRHPERFTFAFIGEGELPIPSAPWSKDLGFVKEEARRDLMAGADALVQLSCMESLSLAVLEAWAQGTPAIVHQNCAVLAGQVGRSQGGRAISGYAAFAAALDDLWAQPQCWRKLGRQGQAYVRETYGDRGIFIERLEKAIAGLATPLADHMRKQGPIRASSCNRAAWREQFGRIVEDVLHAPPRPVRQRVEVRPRVNNRKVAAGQSVLLVPVRVANLGTHPLIAEGQARQVLRCEVRDESGCPVSLPANETALPSLVLPGQTVPAAVTVPVPATPGIYHVVFRVESAMNHENTATAAPVSSNGTMKLAVDAPGQHPAGRLPSILLEAVQSALVQAQKLQRLPDDYEDITEGWLASWKRGIKRKLLNNFKRGYVDVLSRQQSAFNRQVLTVLQELVEYGATLEHAVQQDCRLQIADCKLTNPEQGLGPDGIPPGIGGDSNGQNLQSAICNLQSELVRTRQRCAELEQRLARLEALVLGRGMVIT